MLFCKCTHKIYQIKLYTNEVLSQLGCFVAMYYDTATTTSSVECLGFSFLICCVCCSFLPLFFLSWYLFVLFVFENIWMCVICIYQGQTLFSTSFPNKIENKSRQSFDFSLCFSLLHLQPEFYFNKIHILHSSTHSLILSTFCVLLYNPNGSHNLSLEYIDYVFHLQFSLYNNLIILLSLFTIEAINLFDLKS